jgi:hypothetical protein
MTETNGDLPRLKLDPGQFVFRFGAKDGGDALFIVEDGELSLCPGSDDGARPLPLKRGDVFGGTVGLGPGRVSVKAATASRVIRLEAALAEALLAASDGDAARAALFTEIRRSLIERVATLVAAAAASTAAGDKAVGPTPRLIADSHVFPLGPPQGLLVGRSSTSKGPVDVDLSALPSAPTVSRRHLWIRPLEGGFVADPAGETEVLVNGELVRAGQPRPLKDGDVLRLGEAELMFRLG